jgi:hypothetical protein
MTCTACEREIDERAVFCPLCGADPMCGEPWVSTLGGANGEMGSLMPDFSQIRGMSPEELVLPILHRAYLLSQTENVLAAMSLALLGEDHASERITPRRVLRLMDYQFACAEMAARALLSYYNANDAWFFGYDHPHVRWALEKAGEFECYTHAHDSAQLRDLLQRRVRTKMARLGGVLPETWEPEDESFRITYNGLLLGPLPGDRAASMLGMENVETGPDCTSGELRLTLVPAVWRAWGDEALAAPAMTFVYEQSPQVGMDLRSDSRTREDQLESVAQEHADLLAEKWETDVTWETMTYPGSSTVECCLRHDWRDGEIVQRHRWLYLPGRTYFLRCFSPVDAPAYIDAVEGALDGFVPRGLEVEGP